ncbi:MAG: putative amino-acid metabolite efflux pump [Candidatus Accumulibacter appositus]|uniref:Putative amino-acid metabolite efflux pump n=1 Tax=Candidatus Accumulibacter appositus TaxID=1454003 RepID=A0A011PWN8_9PROT|nr:EamA family transporter [Accumulibacter sp.]EXI81417.1 MAG: putative amino-acid metabolite efflux pump [Candidatus Accumulibacter appositus]HRF03271.1 EamA family transporter [Accumulibacter sp.]
MRPLDIALALLVVLVWGVNFAVIRIGVGEVPPLLLGALRFMLAACPAVFLLRPPKLPLRLYLAYGLSISVGQFAFLFTAIHLGMPSGLASLVLQSQAFFTMLFAALWLKETWRGSQLAGLLLAACGLVLIGSAHGMSMPLLGFMLTLAAASMWAVGNIVTRAVARHGPINQFAFVVWASLVPPLPFFALSLLIEGPARIAGALAAFSWQSCAAVAYLAWVATLLGYGLWTRLLSRYPANQVAPFSLLIPLVGLSTGWLAFGEVLRPVHFAGAALLMLGLAVNLFTDRLLIWARVRA